jgi:hypothetical protein
MSIRSKAILVGELVAATAVFVFLSPFLAVAVLAVGKYSSLDDLHARRKWHNELFAKTC